MFWREKADEMEKGAIKQSLKYTFWHMKFLLKCQELVIPYTCRTKTMKVQPKASDAARCSLVL